MRKSGMLMPVSALPGDMESDVFQKKRMNL